VPGLAISPEKSADLVVSPYSTFLALLVDARSAMENIRRMKGLGWLGPYGFYEAADFTPTRLQPGNKFELVRCWLAHHQGMSLMAVANVLCNGSSQRRFHADPRVAATERLLHEKAPRAAKLQVPAARDVVDAKAGQQSIQAETAGPAATYAANANTAA
jgi:cyclic beta-1,2-glucan synthetase